MPPAADPSWIIHMKQELAGNPEYCKSNYEKPCITRVPPPLHVVKPSAFTPQTVAIGPFHRNLVRDGTYAFSFEAMEEYKVEAVKILSAQSSCEGAGLFEKLVGEIATAEEEVRACFGREMGLAALGIEELSHMLALDCIFIVAFLHSFYNQLHADDDKTWWVPSSFSLVYEGRFPYPIKKAVMLDLLLLENQVPLFLVKKVMELMDGRMYGEDVEASFQALVDAVADKALPFCKEAKRVGAHHAKHLLDCLYTIVTNNMDDQSLINPDQITNPLLQDNGPRYGQLVHVPTATQLHQAGVRFKGHNRSLSHVTFKGHTLTLPIIHVGDETECIFRNLLAHESQLVDRVDVASYLHFMNSLINTHVDVGVLVEAGVINENIGDYKYMARLWNNLATNTMCIFTPQYSHVATLAKDYVDSDIHRVMAELQERYFSRPWLVISLLSGMALLIMNFVIMWYTIKVYIKA